MQNLFKTIFKQRKFPLVTVEFNLSLTKQGEARANLKSYSVRLPFRVEHLLHARHRKRSIEKLDTLHSWSRSSDGGHQVPTTIYNKRKINAISIKV